MTSALLSARTADVAAPPIRVLFADDSPAIRTLARYALSARHGFAVVAEAADGAEALELFDTHQPDCVVLDVDMPVMDGFAALAELRRRSPNVPVVMLSGFSNEATTERALGAGAAAYLEKSSQLTQLGTTIRRVVTPVDRPGAVAEPSAHAESWVEAERPDAARAELRRFEYVVSHDLAEPVRIVNGFATLLQSRYAETMDVGGQAFLTHITAAAGRMQGMIDDLLVYSRAAASQPHIVATPVADIVDAVHRELEAALSERGAQISTADLPAAMCDADMMTTILRQVVLNAITFNTSTTPSVHITGSLAGGVAVLTINDNGIGVDPAQSERIFDLFVRLNTRDEYPGNGAGLALCRRLLSLQGGTAVLTSSPGTGSTVILTLPAPHGQPADPPSAPLPDQPSDLLGDTP